MSDLFKEGQEKVGRKLTKEETKAGLDAFLEEGDFDKALTTIQLWSKWGKEFQKLKHLRTMLPEEYQSLDKHGEFIGNVAYSNADIGGKALNEVKSFSKYGNVGKKGIINKVDGWISSVENPRYSASVLIVYSKNEIDPVKGFLRNNDTEYKIIEYYNELFMT